MATTSILGFGTAATNELSDAAYAADAQRLSGNVPGIARSQLVNKAAHQASAVAAGIGQWLADRQSTNVTDQLTPSQFSIMLSSILSVGGFQRFQSNGSWTCPAGVTQVIVFAAAGGGGGGGGGGAASGIGSGGGGGGAGNVALGVVMTVVPGTVYPIVIGAGGSAGAGAAGSASNGGTGGNTTFGTIALAAGQGGQGGFSAPTPVPGAQGGVGFPFGGWGQDSTTNNASASGGTGASCPMGGGGAGGRGSSSTGLSQAGQPGGGFGSGGGGGGGVYSLSGNGAAGAAGAPGFLYFYY